MMTDCPARASSPSRPAASATISNAALFRVVGVPKTLHDAEIYVPFRADHEDARECQAEKSATTLGVEDGTGLQTAPGSVCLVCGRQPCRDDQQDESEPVGDRQCDGATQHSERSVVNQDHVQSKIDRPDDDQDQGRGSHDAYRRLSKTAARVKLLRLTLALQVFLERFKGDESRGRKDEYPHDILHVFAETDGLSDSQEDGFYEEP